MFSISPVLQNLRLPTAPVTTESRHNPRKARTYLLYPAFIVVLLLSMTNVAHAVGATTPFTSYEAEAGTIGGGATVVSLTAPPTTEFSSPALEASGHAYVQLTAPGQYVQWTNNTGQSISAINIRACIPDSPGGGGINSSIDLYVDGTLRQAVPLSSTQTWVYET